MPNKNMEAQEANRARETFLNNWAEDSIQVTQNEKFGSTEMQRFNNGFAELLKAVFKTDMQVGLINPETLGTRMRSGWVPLVASDMKQITKGTVHHLTDAKMRTFGLSVNVDGNLVFDDLVVATMPLEVFNTRSGNIDSASNKMDDKVFGVQSKEVKIREGNLTKTVNVKAEKEEVVGS